MSDATPRPPKRSSERASAYGDRQSKSGRPLSTAFEYAKRGVASGAFAGVAGVVTLARVRRALRNGSADDAVRQATMAVFWIGVAMTLWWTHRSSTPDAGSSDVRR